MNHKYRLFALIAIAILISLTKAEAYEFALRASRTQFPIIEGKTDAPDGSAFIVVLKRPWLPDGNARIARGLAACGDSCIPATDQSGAIGARVKVKNGGFFAGPFSFSGKPIAPGIYPVEISPWVDLKTAPIEKLKEIMTPIFSGQVQIEGPSTSDNTAETFYQSRYFLAGFLLRASKVCQGDKQDIEIAFSLLGTNELKAFSQNFPTKSEQWMTEGANNFNTGVFQNGIPKTCDYALEVQKRAQQIVQNDR